MLFRSINQNFIYLIQIVKDKGLIDNKSRRPSSTMHCSEVQVGMTVESYDDFQVIFKVTELNSDSFDCMTHKCVFFFFLPPL